MIDRELIDKHREYFDARMRPERFDQLSVDRDPTDPAAPPPPDPATSPGIKLLDTLRQPAKRGRKPGKLSDYGKANCATCGREFTKRNYKALNCSTDCSMAYNEKQIREGRKVGKYRKVYRYKLNPEACPHPKWHLNGKPKCGKQREICKGCGVTRPAERRAA